MLTVEAAAGCVTVRRRVDRRKISANFVSTDTISDKKDNHSEDAGEGDERRQRAVEAEEEAAVMRVDVDGLWGRLREMKAEKEHGTFSAQDLCHVRVWYLWALPTGTAHPGGPRASQGRNPAAWGGSWRPLLAGGTRYRKCPVQALITLTLSITSSKKMVYTPLFL